MIREIVIAIGLVQAIGLAADSCLLEDERNSREVTKLKQEARLKEEINKAISKISNKIIAKGVTQTAVVDGRVINDVAKFFRGRGFKVNIKPSAFSGYKEIEILVP